MIRLEGVSVRGDDGAILDAVTVQATERRVGVIGANGSGKSTFARLLNGLVQPSAGRVTVAGLDVAREVRAVRKAVGFVFQHPDHQIVMPLVEEDVAFGLRNRGYGRDEVAARVDEVLQRFGLAHLRERPCHSLSGGEKQLLALAGAVAVEPALIVFDEPTALLDLRNRNRVREAVAALEQHVLLVTHDLALVEDFDRVLVLDRGRIRFDGPPAAAIADYRRAMGGAVTDGP